MSQLLRFTIADLDAMPEKEGVRYEIIDGELHVSTQPHPYHQLTTGRFFRVLANLDETSGGVTVNGTERPDHLRVNTDGGGVTVAGLQTETQITGAETADQLRVNTLGGNDRVDVDRNVGTLIGVAVDLGPGQHRHP